MGQDAECLNGFPQLLALIVAHVNKTHENIWIDLWFMMKFLFSLVALCDASLSWQVHSRKLTSENHTGTVFD